MCFNSGIINDAIVIISSKKKHFGKSNKIELQKMNKKGCIDSANHYANHYYFSVQSYSTLCIRYLLHCRKGLISEVTVIGTVNPIPLSCFIPQCYLAFFALFPLLFHY